MHWPPEAAGAPPLLHGGGAADAPRHCQAMLQNLTHTTPIARVGFLTKRKRPFGAAMGRKRMVGFQQD